MSQRETYPPGVPCWVDTLQPDLEATSRFYGGLFGWELSGPGPMPDDPQGRYFVARLRGRDIAGLAAQPSVRSSTRCAWNTYVSVADVDAAAGRARGAGGVVEVPPMDVRPAGRMAVLADPAGARFTVWQPGDRAGARLVNEPGAWAMSLLQAPDLESAARFYGAMFGWTTEALSMGGSTIVLFRLPGYVGGEPEQPVSREVVATMVGAPTGAQPRWDVDFWVDDVDRAAQSAALLSGTVVAPPVPTPVGRTAILADPHGATFSVSQVGVRRS